MAADKVKSSEQAPTDNVPHEQAWSDVFSAGISLLEKLSGAISAGKKGDRSTGGEIALPKGIIATDDSSGRPYIKLPLPAPEMLKKITDLLEAFVS